jgi:hypothetical protein
MRNHLQTLLLALLLLIGGCAAKEELIAKSAMVPIGVDLTGTWQLRADSQEAIRHGLRSDSALVNVFLETGDLLKLTQTDYALFVSFDRAIVEEYRFGEKRTVNVGPIEADRVSGWEGRRYIIETLDDDGAKLVDSYGLSPDGGEMMRTFKIIDGESVQVDVEQIFDRAF